MTIKFKAGRNVRDLDINGIDLDIRNDREVEIIPRYLKSIEFKKCLFEGRLRICEGELKFKYKNASCLINSVSPNSMLLNKNGDMFVKDLDTSEIVPYVEVVEEVLDNLDIKSEEVPKEDVEKGKALAQVEAPIEIDFDIEKENDEDFLF